MFGEFKLQRIKTEYGTVELLEKDNLYFIQRHGNKPYLPPHKINYHANLMALKELGVEQIISVNSVGSLKENIKPGTFVVVDDYFSPWFIPTYFDEQAVHTSPNIDKPLRKLLVDTIKQLGFNLENVGTYVHALGPRFETKAEIRWMSQVGDVVGMTAGGEIALANELKLPIALLTMVDNFANGISGEDVNYKDFKVQSKMNLLKVEAVLRSALDSF